MSDETPPYAQEFLGEARRFLDALKSDEGKGKLLASWRDFLPKEMFEVAFSLVPRACVDAVIIDGNRYVALVTRDVGINMGRWNIPGGTIRYEEVLEEAVVKKAKSETGLDVVVDKEILPDGIISVYDGREFPGHNVDRVVWERGREFYDANPDVFYRSLGIAYLTRPVGGELIKDERREARFWGMEDNELPDVVAYHHVNIIRDTRKLIQNLYGK